MTRYKMDDATFTHLTAWCERESYDEEADALRERMILFLEAQESEDAEYSLSHGWRHVYDLLS